MWTRWDVSRIGAHELWRGHRQAVGEGEVDRQMMPLEPPAPRCAFGRIAKHGKPVVHAAELRCLLAPKVFLFALLRQHFERQFTKHVIEHHDCARLEITLVTERLEQKLLNRRTLIVGEVAESDASPSSIVRESRQVVPM